MAEQTQNNSDVDLDDYQQDVPDVPDLGDNLREDLDDDPIDYEEVLHEGLDEQREHTQVDNMEGHYSLGLVAAFKFHRFVRRYAIDYTSRINHSLTRIIKVLNTLNEQANDGRGVSHIRDHIAIRDESESWTKLPDKYITAEMTNEDLRGFYTKFARAVLADVAYMAEGMRIILDEVFISDTQRRIDLPDDNGPVRDEELYDWVRDIDTERPDEMGTEDLRVSRQTQKIIATLQKLVNILSIFHRDTAESRRRLRDAIRVCDRVDPNFNDRTPYQKRTIYQELAMRALQASDPITENKMHNMSVWSAFAYTAHKVHLDALMTELKNITIVRNSVARLLRDGVRAAGFEQDETMRRIQEYEASQLACTPQFFHEDLPAASLLWMEERNQKSEQDSDVAEFEHMGRQIVALDGKLKLAERKMAEDSRMVEAQAIQIEDLGRKLQVDDDSLVQAGETIEQANKTSIENKERLKSMKNKCRAMKEDLEGKDRQIKALNRTLEVRDKDVTVMSGKLKTISTRVTVLRKELVRREETYNDLVALASQLT